MERETNIYEGKKKTSVERDGNESKTVTSLSYSSMNVTRHDSLRKNIYKS